MNTSASPTRYNPNQSPTAEGGYIKSVLTRVGRRVLEKRGDPEKHSLESIRRLGAGKILARTVIGLTLAAAGTVAVDHQNKDAKFIDQLERPSEEVQTDFDSGKFERGKVVKVTFQEGNTPSLQSGIRS